MASVNELAPVKQNAYFNHINHEKIHNVNLMPTLIATRHLVSTIQQIKAELLSTFNFCNTLSGNIAGAAVETESILTSDESHSFD